MNAILISRKLFSGLAIFFGIIFLTACGGEPKSPPMPLAPSTPPAVLPEQDTPSSASQPDRQVLLDQYFNQLKDRAVNYKKIGNILEQLITIQLETQYPAERYEILNGIEYQEEGGRTVGELDVIVFDRKTGNAEMVVEAKLSSNLKSAGKKASSQIKRFRAYLAEGKITKFHYIAHPEREFTVKQFGNVKIVKIGSSGAPAHGFDSEFDLRRDEADVLQERLLTYKGESLPRRKAAGKKQQTGQDNQAEGE